MPLLKCYTISNFPNMPMKNNIVNYKMVAKFMVLVTYYFDTEDTQSTLIFGYS